MTVEISTTLRKEKYVKNIPYQKIVEKVLGKKYELSLVFCGPYLSKKLNKKYRRKNYIANVLTFPLSKNSGEIFIKLPVNKQYSVLELFIHGLAHLQGYFHTNKKEIEKMQKFELYVAKAMKSTEKKL